MSLWAQVYETLGDAAAHEAFLRQHFPSIPPDAAQHAARQLAEAPPSVGGISTRCATLCSGRVVLVGDAGHSCVPTLGHGANSALESAALLAAALKAAGGAASVASGKLEEALEAYSRQRLPDAHAVVQLSEEGFTAPFMFPRVREHPLEKLVKPNGNRHSKTTRRFFDRLHALRTLPSYVCLSAADADSDGPPQGAAMACPQPGFLPAAWHGPTLLHPSAPHAEGGGSFQGSWAAAGCYSACLGSPPHIAPGTSIVAQHDWGSTSLRWIIQEGQEQMECQQLQQVYNLI